MNQNKAQMVNTNTASKMLGVSPKTLRRWCSDGFISYYITVGGQRRFSVREIQEFLEKNHVKSDV